MSGRNNDRKMGKKRKQKLIEGNKRGSFLKKIR
jgi:hypothetical protein